jgi:uncharacterized protein (TIGR00251 family)
MMAKGAVPCCELVLRVVPRAARSELAGWQEGVLRIRLTAAPVDGAANRACLQLVAQALGVRESAVRLVAGERSRNKRVRVEGLSAADARTRLAGATARTREG